jgi:hypothetical protein
VEAEQGDAERGYSGPLAFVPGTIAANTAGTHYRLR